MSEQLNEYQTRIQKLENLKKAWVVPYANKFSKTHSTIDLQTLWKEGKLSPADILLEKGSVSTYSTAWRMMMFRTHGKLSFATIKDDVWEIQIAFLKWLCSFNTGHKTVDSLEINGQEVTAYKFVEKYFDVGDFIGVHGELFETNHWELTLFVNEFQMMSKALRPLWDKWHWVKDEEKLYRQRYLDMTMNNDSYDRFLFKTKFYDALREFYKNQWFQEIVTSILWNSASWAAAKPFITHHNDYDLDVFLRIAFEPALKMATVWRYEKVFEIWKDFRNEWSDPSHLQEFTQVEHYAAYWNYEDNMKFAEDMFDYLFKALELPKIITIKDKEWKENPVDFSTPWERIDYIEWVKKASWWIDITKYGMNDEEQLRTDIKEAWHQWVWMEQQWTTTLIDYLYKKVLRPWIIWPAFVYNYPKTMQPLARQSDANPDIVEQFQVVVNWWEVIKAYSELVDPTIQEANFEEQAWAIEKWDEEATSWDDDFVLAMEHAMPPQSWFGMWLERILALLTWQDNLRDVVMFPLMKPGKPSNQAWKSKETKIAVALINKELNLEPWQEMNTIWHLSASLWARWGKKLLQQDTIKTKDWKEITLNIQHAIMIKESSSNSMLHELLSKAKEAWVETTEFTQEMIATTDDAKVVSMTVDKTHAEIEYLWILLFGNKKTIDKLTWWFQLYSGSSATKKENKILPEKTTIIESEVTIDNASSLMDKYLTDTKRHCHQVWHCMRYFAEKLWEDADFWQIVWMLHDVDRDHINKDAWSHLWDQFEAMLDEIWADDHLKNIIKSHYPDGTWVQPESLIEKYLISVDELSGLLYAYSLMRPEWFTGMKRKSINKKIKDKWFASWVDREHVKNCETYLEIPLNEFALDVAQALATFTE